jgi:hypothetical protein
MPLLSVRVATRDIRTSTTITSCDVCGRTLLRGERAQVYLDGSARRSVCELCTSRALSEGWVREGTVPSYEGRDGGADRRRSLFGRLRRRREPQADPPMEEYEPPVEAPDERSWTEPLKRARERIREEPPLGRAREVAREPRHVRAVPTSVENKIAAAIDFFNQSEHQRTVAGVARSLGSPDVSVRPVDGWPSLVNVVVSWELCWYRYAIDLSEDVPSVRVDAQGYELDELMPVEREPNAVCDEHGALSFRG